MLSKTGQQMPDIRHVQWFVQGYMMEYFMAIRHNKTEQKLELDENNVQYISRTVDVVYGYMRGTKILDGSCSDIQCSCASEAEKLFLPRADRSLDDREFWTVDPREDNPALVYDSLCTEDMAPMVRVYARDRLERRNLAVRVANALNFKEKK